MGSAFVVLAGGGGGLAHLVPVAVVVCGVYAALRIGQLCVGWFGRPGRLPRGRSAPGEDA